MAPDVQVLKIIANADPKLRFIPQRLINFALRNCCSVALNMIERMSQNLPDEYHRLIAEKEEFYTAVREKITNTLTVPANGPAL